MLASPFLPSVLADLDFSAYPQCAQPILYGNAPASCDYGDVGSETQLTNQCLCSNRGFLTDSAKDIYANCGCSDLQASAQTNSDNCERTQVPSVLGVDDYVQAGAGTACSGGGGGLDAGAIVGIVFGIVAFLALVVAVVQLAAMYYGWSEQHRPSRFLKAMFCCCRFC